MKDVVVLGAGNVGLFAAVLLRQQGLDVTVVDPRPPAPWHAPAGFDARVYALHARNRAALTDAGIWSRLDDTRIGTIQRMAVVGDADGELAFGRSDQPALAHVVEDGALQAALLATWQAAGGSPVLAAQVVAVEPGAQACRLMLADGRTLNPRLVIGADGAQSWLRQTLGWPAQVREYGQHGLVVNATCSVPHGQVARQWFQAGEVIALLPLGGQHVSLVWSAASRHAAHLQALAPAARQAALSTRIGQPLGPLTECSQPATFPLRLLTVPRIADHRVVLLGDAAHGIHPLAGQGLNLGLEDARCLAAVLADRPPGPDAGDRTLLRRHARKRAAPVARMQAVTDGLLRLFAHPAPWSRWLRNHGMSGVQRLTPLRLLLERAAEGT